MLVDSFQDMNVPIVEPDVKKDRIRLLVDYFTVNRNNHQVQIRQLFLMQEKCSLNSLRMLSKQTSML